MTATDSTSAWSGRFSAKSHPAHHPKPRRSHEMPVKQGFLRCLRFPPHPPLRAPRTENVAKARELLALHAPSCEPKPADPPPPHPRACPCCGGRMRVIEVFTRGQAPRHWVTPTPISIDTLMSEHHTSTSVCEDLSRWPAAGDDHPRPPLGYVPLPSQQTRALRRPFAPLHYHPRRCLARSRALHGRTCVATNSRTSLNSP